MNRAIGLYSCVAITLLLHAGCSDDEGTPLGAAGTSNAGGAAGVGGAANVGGDTQTDSGTSPGQDASNPPPGDGGEPVSCESDTDCAAAGACPSDAKIGCSCADTPSGMKCVPKCTTASDCNDPSQVCSSGVCVPGGEGGNPPPGDGGAPAMDLANTVSDNAQSMTIAFDGLAFVTGTFCTQTFYPPGKVADFFGFQYLRDNDKTNMGHNVEFTTLTGDAVLGLLTSSQVQTLADIGAEDTLLGKEYGEARFPLAMAFRRLYDKSLPAGKTGLDLNAVKAFSGYLFTIDGKMSYLRAQAYASVLNSMSADQKTKLQLIKNGAASNEWKALVPDASVVHDIMAQHPANGGDLRTYAGEMLSWYAGGIDPDVYFCPERQGTYFGSFFMKDVKAMANPGTTIDSNMTGDMGDFFLKQLDTTQAKKVTDLVTTQKTALGDATSSFGLTGKRKEISALLRGFLSGSPPSEDQVLALSFDYGEFDGEISYLYATAFSSLELTDAQLALLMEERKLATAETGGTPDYDVSKCGSGHWDYSTYDTAPATVINTDFMFGVCQAAGSACQTDWGCCSFKCVSGKCGN